MTETWVVSRGVDTLVVNVFYLDEDLETIQGERRKRSRELIGPLRERLEEWKKEAIGSHDEMATSLTFNNKLLHMQPNGAGRGQWPWMLKTRDMTLYISGGNWNGVASVRLSSQYLWSLPDVTVALDAVQLFVDDLFEQKMYLQVSQVDLCVDVAGWSDIDWLDRGTHFVSRARKGGGYDETGQVLDMISRDYTLGLKRTGFDFGRSQKKSSSLSCRIYDKTRELEKSGKEWFFDLWRSRGWSEDDGPVWRVEFSFKREALHELLQEVGGEEQFHGVENAFDLSDRLALLWAYAAGQLEGGPDGQPDGWLRCVVPQPSDRSRSRWPTHPAWKVVQGAFLEDIEIPPQFGKIIRKKWERHNIEEGVEAVVGYLSSLAAWATEEISTELASEYVDLSGALYWLSVEGEKYLKRTGRDFTVEVQRKRARFGVSLAGMEE